MQTLRSRLVGSSVLLCFVRFARFLANGRLIWTLDLEDRTGAIDGEWRIDPGLRTEGEDEMTDTEFRSWFNRSLVRSPSFLLLVGSLDSFLYSQTRRSAHSPLPFTLLERILSVLPGCTSGIADINIASINCPDRTSV